MNWIVYTLARFTAWSGALILTAIALMSFISIIGRALTPLGLAPVSGDFELVEAGTALAVFCFLPWCHLTRGHARVDLFWKSYPPAMRRALDVLADALMLLAWLFLTWRMGVATTEYRDNGEMSFILQMPVWFGYAASMVPAVFGCVAYLWRLLESLGLASPPAAYAAAAGAGGGH